MAEKCAVPACGKDAVEFLVFRPGQLMVLDGGLSVSARCDDHPAAKHQEQIKAADPDAVFWRFRRSDGWPLTQGVYTLSGD